MLGNAFEQPGANVSWSIRAQKLLYKRVLPVFAKLADHGQMTWTCVN